jgi:hypothetical protein
VVDDTTAASVQPCSILEGVDELVDQTLGITHVGQTAPHYRHLSAYRAVSSGPRIDGGRLIAEMYRIIASNWPGTPCRGSQNWRWEKQTFISDANESLEKQFEKAIAAESPEWMNMIPVASGLLPNVEESGRRIDLARRLGEAEYEFLELKLGKYCDNPLYAMIELLGYGLIYLFSRAHRDRLGYPASNPLLSAKRISLKVVAPTASYLSGSLLAVQEEVNYGFG